MNTASFRILVLTFVSVITLTGCSISQALALKDCSYEYSSMSDVNLAGLTLENVRSVSGYAELTQRSIRAIANKEATFPVGMTAHIRVTNPNKRRIAAIEGIYYSVDLDSIRIADGKSEQSLMVMPQSSADLPLAVNMDLKPILSKEMRPVLRNVLANMLHRSDTPTVITVWIRPVLKLGSSYHTTPKPIPVRIEYTGKKKND